jgi:hydrogenase nickel incorporation protein HypA/HybF
MHEFSIAVSLVETVNEFASSRQIEQVRLVRLALGELTCVEREQLLFCYQALTKETPLENSELDIETVHAEVKCPKCAYHGPPKYWEEALISAIPTLQCPDCGGAAEATLGHECAIRSIQYVS